MSRNRGFPFLAQPQQNQVQTIWQITVPLGTEMMHLNKIYQTLYNTIHHEDVVLALDQMEGEK